MNLRPRLVSPSDEPRDPLAEQKIAALAALAAAAHAAEELERAAQGSDKLTAYARWRLHHLSVAISASVEGIGADIAKVNQKDQTR